MGDRPSGTLTQPPLAPPRPSTWVRRRSELPFVGAVVASWIAVAAATWSGNGSILHHDAIVDSSHPALAVLFFVLAWQAMVGAMMLPSTLPMLTLFGAASARQDRSRPAMAAFVGAYFTVWTVFGLSALAFDVGVHHFVDADHFLSDHPWTVAAATLGVAGAFQFTPWRAQCMRVCRHPFGFMMQHYRPGVRGAMTLGLRHGLFCLGCCWALMLVMFGVGLSDLTWMATLTAVMVYEKVGRHGEGVARAAGIVLLAWAALVAFDPNWLPRVLAGGR